MSKLNYLEFADLSLEHEVFEEFLAARRNPLPSPQELRELAGILEKLHHEKEEKLLFPVLFGTAVLEVGGPKCMTFFTPRVIGGTGWEDSFAALRSAMEYSGPLPGELDEFRARVFAENSMLKIPLEDHILGARALAAILDQPAQPALQGRRVRGFLELLHDHIRREEECLLVLLRRILSPAQKEAYAAAAAAFDEAHGTREALARFRTCFRQS